MFPVSEILGNSIRLNDSTPLSIALQPIFEDFSDTSVVVGHYLAVIEWEFYFSRVLHQGAHGIVVILKNSCGQAYTFVVNGDQATFIGEGDNHNSKYDKYKKSAKLFDPSETIRLQEDDHCFYSIDVFPSDDMKDDYISSDPLVYSAIVLVIMLGTAVVFQLYETLVQRHQRKVLEKVVKTNAIVSSLFPENVRDRLIHGGVKESGTKRRPLVSGKSGLKSFLDDSEEKKNEAIGESRPIADLFPSTVSEPKAT